MILKRVFAKGTRLTEHKQMNQTNSVRPLTSLRWPWEKKKNPKVVSIGKDGLDFLWVLLVSFAE